MKTLVACSIVLLLGVLEIKRETGEPFDAAWSLGLLLLVAFLGQQIAQLLRLPSLVGWLGAGLLVGTSGLGTVQPAGETALQLLHIFTGIWFGFQTGLGNPWISNQKNWLLVATLGLSTLAAFVLIALILPLATSISWQFALLCGALASLWGPFTLSAVIAHRDAILLGLWGNAFSLVILSLLLMVLWGQGYLPIAALHFVALLWSSLLLGAASAEALGRCNITSTPSRALFAFGSSFALAALFLHQFQLFSLPFGVAVGLVLARREDQQARFREVLDSTRPIVAMVFFAFLGATLDLSAMIPPLGGLFNILLVQLVVLILLRGLGPMTRYPLPALPTFSSKSIGWLFLTKGALLFELVLRPQLNLTDLLVAPYTQILAQVALAEILLYGLVFSVVAALVWRLVQRTKIEPA